MSEFFFIYAIFCLIYFKSSWVRATLARYSGKNSLSLFRRLIKACKGISSSANLSAGLFGEESDFLLKDWLFVIDDLLLLTIFEVLASFKLALDWDRLEKVTRFFKKFFTLSLFLTRLTESSDPSELSEPLFIEFFEAFDESELKRER